MNPTHRKSLLPESLEKAFPLSRRKDLMLDVDDAGEPSGRAFLAAVRRARPRECLVLPPGVYPMPPLSHSFALRAQKHGTVRLVADGKVVPSVSTSDPIWLSGIEICAAEGEDVALNQTQGVLFLTNCRIRGGLVSAGKNTRLFLSACHLEAQVVGLEATNLSEVEVASSVIAQCQVGISLSHGSSLLLINSRFEQNIGRADLSPGAGLHAEAASVICKGGLFVGNDIGAHLVNCSQAAFAFCRFESQSLSSIVALGSGNLGIASSIFQQQAGTDYAHVSLENIHATVKNATFDQSTLPDIQTQGGSLTRDTLLRPADENQDVLTKTLQQIRSMVGIQKSRTTLETLIHQAHAARTFRERGVSSSHTSFHCVFEGDEPAALQRAAMLMARAMGSLGVSSNPRVEEVQLLDLMTGTISLHDVIARARGGLLLVTAPEKLGRKEGVPTYDHARTVVGKVSEACDEDVVFVLAGSRDVVRPMLSNSAEMEELFRSIVSFSAPSPPALAELFEGLCVERGIVLTSLAKIKTLLVFHMLDDRGDRRFLSLNGVQSLLSLAERRYLEQCSRKGNYDLPMVESDLAFPLSQLADSLLEVQPDIVCICPACGAEMPWVPGLPPEIACEECGNKWMPGYGVWRGSSYYRRLKDEGENDLPPRISALRKRLPFQRQGT